MFTYIHTYIYIYIYTYIHIYIHIYYQTVPFSFLPFMMAGLVCAVGVAAIVLEPTMTHAYLGYTRLISSTGLESSEKEKMEPLF